MARHEPFAGARSPVEGSGTARYASSRRNTTHFHGVVTDADDRVDTFPGYLGGYSRYHVRRSIVDPARNPDWVTTFLRPNLVTRSDGIKFMRLWFAGGVPSMPWFRVRTETYDTSCQGETTHDVDLADEGNYCPVISMEPGVGPTNEPTLECDRADSVCSWNHTYRSLIGSPMSITRSATAQRPSACRHMAAPIDGASPNLDDIDDIAVSFSPEGVLPSGEFTVQAKVTCSGVPINDARLTVKVNATVNSGGHIHMVRGRRPSCLVSLSVGCLSRACSARASPNGRLCHETDDQHSV
jgi:hypothetical protein